MSSVVDLWRALDPEARMASGDVDALGRAVRGVLRSRSAPPHLPPAADGELLIIDAALFGRRLDAVLAGLRDAELRPTAVLLAGAHPEIAFEAASGELPILVSARAVAPLVELARAYLDDEVGHLGRLAIQLRLAAAEAALADPRPAAPCGLLAARIRRGVAIAADGELQALTPRPAGRALAARFAATHARLLATGSSAGGRRQPRDGLWLLEHRIRSGASVWLFDDMPFARVDEVAAEALGITMRALLSRPPLAAPAPALPAPEPSDAWSATLLAVARTNGRIAPAARALGVHRNTVLYRLRAARAAQGIDPRRPADALRILRQSET
ncbi:MAG: helix-turn-helix domain-containing protein [Chloroflexota bacterium]